MLDVATSDDMAPTPRLEGLCSAAVSEKIRTRGHRAARERLALDVADDLPR
jgi:hypothetical protein